MNIYAHAENIAQLLMITFPYFECQETLGGWSHGTIQKSEHGYKTSYYVVNTEILNTQGIQNNSRCVQRYQHGQYHAEIQHQRIFCDTFVALPYGKFRSVLFHNKKFILSNQ